MKKRICLILAAAVMLTAGCGKKGRESLLDPDSPVSITVWHYYNGSQQAAFESLVDEFNTTVGKEEGIYVQSYSYGSVEELVTQVADSLDEKVGAGKVPDIFSTYGDTAYEINKKGQLADISAYFTEEELGEYVDSYIEEGRLGEDDGLKIFPVAKSTEVLMINGTEWEKFARETGASVEELQTLEGVVKTAEKYYEWTDAQTPDIPDDGRAFYGRDSMANYFYVGMKQMGKDLAVEEDGKVTLNIEKEDIRRLWDNYYVPYVQGYFGSYGKFRSDDVKTGDLAAFTGSTAASMFFPKNVEQEDESYPITCMVMDAPVLEGGQQYRVQQGAGMAVVKGQEKNEYASAVFLKWFTRPENNFRFGCEAGYLPVKKEASDMEILDKVIKEEGLSISDSTYTCFSTVFQNTSGKSWYTMQNFDNSNDIRSVLEYSLSDKASKDREAVVSQIQKGTSRKEAVSAYLTEENFENWYEEFQTAMEKALQA